MITIWGGGASRSFRVSWLAEEMGLDYALRYVDLIDNPEEPEFLAVNPGGYIPVLQDGDVTMVESVAMMEYLIARYGPTPLAPAPSDVAFPLYQQFLHLGEAGLAGATYIVIGGRQFAPESDRNSWSVRQAEEQWASRMRLVERQLARAPWMAGDAFTAADISVGYALLLGTRHGGFVLGDAVRAYFDRITARDAYQGALEKSDAVLVRA
jgi:glutathione S-transferase